MSISIQQMLIGASDRGDEAVATLPSAGRESTLALFAVMGGELPASVGALAPQEGATTTALATGLLALESPSSTSGNAPSTHQVAAAFNPLSDEGSWPQQLVQQIGLLGHSGVEQQRLQLRLDPPYLGSIDVEIVARDGETQVYLNAAHGAVRDALEATLPRLRELFSAEGLALAHAQVGGSGVDDRAQGRRDHGLSEPSQQSGPTD
ncbi:MAG: flagellar hook-length control protein FliK, partial [Pseudomonadota bacterium]|nr:flagellar hook-length control protein FliK [Pseudomonadota bacterium]